MRTFLGVWASYSESTTTTWCLSPNPLSKEYHSKGKPEGGEAPFGNLNSPFSLREKGARGMRACCFMKPLICEVETPLGAACRKRLVAEWKRPYYEGLKKAGLKGG